MTTEVDVVIVGAGPTGLMLACELELAGIHPVVVERLTEPTGLSKALAIVGRAVDMLDYRGLLDRFTVHGAVGTPGFAHFALIPLDLATFGELGLRGVFIQQAHTEEILEERARELGTRILRGHELIDLRQDDDGVSMTVRGPDGDQRLRARYVVGCDGGGSVVRKRAGIGFPGLAPTRLLRLGDVTLREGSVEDGHLALPDGRRIPLFPSVIPLGSGFYRVITHEPYPPDLDRDAPITLDELAASIRRTTGNELPISGARWLSRFTDASHQAEHYRRGHILLAGDAAHTHLPAGGPGLNTGLQDAVNLGWKLAAQIHGWAPQRLLDTYHTERHPEGARVLLHTRAQGAMMIDDGRITALRELFGQLLRHEQTLRHIVDLLYGLDIRYDMCTTATHPLIGRWAPNLPLTTANGTTHLADLMHHGKGVLVNLTRNTATADLAIGWADRVAVVTAPQEQPPAAALLVRPDGYVAWAADPDDDQADTLHHGLSTWFGAAVTGQGGGTQAGCG